MNSHETNSGPRSCAHALPARHVAENFTTAEIAAGLEHTSPHGESADDGLPDFLEHVCGHDLRNLSRLNV